MKQNMKKETKISVFFNKKMYTFKVFLRYVFWGSCLNIFFHSKEDIMAVNMYLLQVVSYQDLEKESLLHL